MNILTKDGNTHEIVTDLEDGRVVVACQSIVEKADGVMVDSAVDCPTCLTPRTTPARPPRAPRARKAQWRPARDAQREAGDSLKHAHKSVVAAIEWFQRGEEMQFLERSLDQAHLAYRFLGELLAKHRRIDPPDDLADEPE